MPRKVIKVWDEDKVGLISVSAPDRETAEELAKEVYEALSKNHNAVMWRGNA